ncbi:bifunctional 3'-5' exonuclease/DNA polymerase [Lentzea sp.]|uniref:bifunctional 3'-5' exonuclease/DNA polymerase n=1 Tax=Lentzea sp. TaxID=56099 RepID=UPI002BC25359|nr:bifunctional 3'-5' exonuclease/DNA polymerase [Lentzea sp.]HUQ55634.1 bifunctional 3'-5' exonuclease/DNA polymerase [Lentzea sp.]
MLVALVPEADGAGRWQELHDDGTPAGPAVAAPSLASAVASLERAHRPRWVWADTSEVYPPLLAAGVRVDRCWDLLLTESLLLGVEGRHREPRELPAALARALGLPAPADLGHRKKDVELTLFEPEPVLLPGDTDELAALSLVFRAQQRNPALGLLIAAESASALVAAEMTHHGLPWREDVHLQILEEVLGPRPAPGARPKLLQDLAEEIQEAFGGREMNPDAPAGIVRAFARVGIEVPSARRWVLKKVDHPAVAPLLDYKERARLWVAHGWSWLDTWVSDGRFRPDYVVGGVVSGRWASRGGAALQIPRSLRRAVVADEGWCLVAADASQLEPRILAALSGDARLIEVCGDDDLYAALAEDSFKGERPRAKIAMLSAMYGGTAGEAGSLLAVLRKRFPVAVGYVEAAAQAGEQGRMVRTRLGRTSPTPSAAWQELTGGADDAGDVSRSSRQAARNWGRFTRNFVVQGSAADWTAALLGVLRTRLPADAHLVFFQHDEVLVHCPRADADAVIEAIAQAGREATRLLFGETSVRFPMNAVPVECYADAK